MSKMCCLAALVLVLALIPSCLANRNGAPAESCFNHSVVHLNPLLPPTFKQDCTGQCGYNFTLIDEVDATDRTSRLGTNVSETFMLTCGSVYEFELTPGLNIGFLVQARESATFDVDSPIRGEWVDVGTIENYIILRCRESSGSLNESTFANSATQRNIGEQDDFITTLYWRAPATPVDVTFYYTIVAGFSTFYNPLFTPRMSVQCASATSTSGETTSTGTTTDSSPGVTGSTTTTTTSTTATDSTTSTTATDSTTATATGRITPTTDALSATENTTLSSNGRQGQQVSLMVVFGWLLLISTILY